MQHCSGSPNGAHSLHRGTPLHRTDMATVECVGHALYHVHIYSYFLSTPGCSHILVELLPPPLFMSARCSFIEGGPKSPLQKIEAIEVIHLLQSDDLSFLRLWTFQLQWIHLRYHSTTVSVNIHYKNVLKNHQSNICRGKLFDVIDYYVFWDIVTQNSLYKM